VLDLYKQTIGATARNIFRRQKTIFTKKSESTVSTAVRRRTAGGSLSKLAMVAAMLLVTATMAETVIPTMAETVIPTMVETATATMAETVIPTMTEIVIATATMAEIVRITIAATELAIQADFT
jgi:hypothetical protein